MDGKNHPDAGIREPLGVIALGQFSFELPPLSPRLTALRVTSRRCVGIDQLPTALSAHEVLLTDCAWMAALTPEKRAALSRRAALAAGWIAFTDGAAPFKQQVEWQRTGVSHFFRRPLDPERLATLIEDIHDRLNGPPLRVILLDDDDSALAYYGKVLGDAGLHVLATADPLLVLDALESQHPDVLVVDIEMPGCRGPELLTIVRQRPEYARLPALFLTAMTSMQDKLLARAAAAEDFLAKPVPTELLLAAVTSQARRYRATRRAETLHQQQQARARLRLEQLHMAIDEHAIVSMTDVKGNITYANDRFCAISGYTREELLGQNHRIVKSDRHPPEVFRAMWHTIANGKTWHGEVCNLSKQGSPYWVEATIVPFLDARENGKGKPVQYVSIRTDITALKQREENLLLFRRIFNASDQCIAVADGQGKVVFVNHAYEKNMGYALREMLGEDFRKYASKDDKGTEIMRTILQERKPWSGLTARRRKDGSEFFAFNSYGFIEDERGDIQFIFVIFSDFTEEIAQRAALATATENAERANQAKSDFLSSMSHELRTPMNAIIGFAQMLEYDAGLDADQQDNVNEILKAGRHLLDLINEVLDLAKIESGRIDLSLEAVALAPLGDDCRHLIQPLADRRRIALHVDLPPEALVFGDRSRLKQVLLNLLSNAVKYNRAEGEIRLALEARENGQMRILVRDTGPGIPPEKMTGLFQPFNRLGAEAGDIEGTGIGLTISRRLIEMMGGEIGAHSEVGIGSTFWVDLPSSQAQEIGASATAHATPTGPTAGAADTCVLAIDDNPSNLKLMAQVFGMRPHIHLITAHAPELGIELALTHRPDLILLDINMPGMDGYQVLEVFKADAALHAIPVIAVTANAMPRDIERGMAAGFTAYLTKPLDIPGLLDTADRVLRSTRSTARA